MDDNTKRPRTRVLIVDDAPQVRQGLRTLLPLAGDRAAFPVEVVGDAADGVEAVALVPALVPDVVLMDLEMPGGDGYAAVRAIKVGSPSTRIVVLTVHGDAASRRRASEAGADAFVVKGSSALVLVHAIIGDELPAYL